MTDAPDLIAAELARCLERERGLVRLAREAVIESGELLAQLRETVSVPDCSSQVATHSRRSRPVARSSPATRSNSVVLPHACSAK